jgi:asparagine synthase (glutamine-hydrolysing)
MSAVVAWDRSHARPVGLPADSESFRILATAGLFGSRREVARLVGRPDEPAETIVLAHLYERFLLDAPRHVTGTLSWILWDERRRRLVAMTDRLGLCPLYLCERKGVLYLSTALEPLLAAAGLDSLAAVERSTIAAYLCGRAPEEGKTFYRGIEVVQAGSYLVVTPERVVADRYWQLERQPVLRLRDDADYAEALREQLGRVFSEHLADAPAAAITLSSGLDSTSVAATLRQISPALRLTAICGVAPELPEADESAGTRAVCEQLGCPAVSVAMDQHWPLRTEPGIRPGRESPRFNCYTDFWSAVFTRVRDQGERILFTGQGGDQLFGGNVFAYGDLLLTGRWGRLSRELRRHRELWNRRVSWIWRWMVLGPVARAFLPLPRRRATPPWLGAGLRSLVAPVWTRPDWRLLPGRRQRMVLLRNRALMEEARYLDDRAAAQGVEMRHPYFDHRLLEFAASLPTEQTFEAGVRKGIVRRAMAGLLPDEILNRPGKIEATAIFARGLRERETAKVWQLLTDMRAADLGWIDPEPLRQAYRDYVEGKTQSTRFWSALTLEAWLRRWFP